MKITLDIYKVTAEKRVELDAETVEKASEKALSMAKSHSIVLSPPKDEYVAIVIKATETVKNKGSMKPSL